MVQSNTPSITVNAAPTVSVAPGPLTMDVGQSRVYSYSIGGSGLLGVISGMWMVVRLVLTV